MKRKSHTNAMKILQIWSHLLEKSLMENYIFCAVIPFNFVVSISGSFPEPS